MAWLTEGWRRFWFEPAEMTTLGLVRIAFALVTLCWTVTLAPDLFAFYGPDGLRPDVPAGAYWAGLLEVPREGVVGLWLVLVLSSVALAVGLRSRLASVLVFACLYWFQRRNPDVLNAGDGLLRIFALYLVLAPTNAALSFDRWRAAPDRFWEPCLRAVWPLRLIQVQISVLYASTVWAKARGTTWNDGTAVSFALRLDDIARFGAPPLVQDSVLTSNILTFGTLGIEAAIAVLVWNRRARPWVLAGGVVLHTAISAWVMVGFFTAALLVGYLAFVPGAAARRGLLRLRATMSHGSRHPEPATAPR